MLDRGYIVQHVDEIRRNCAIRNVGVDLDRFLELDQESRVLTRAKQDLGASANAIARAMASAKGAEREQLRAEGSRTKAERTEIESRLRTLEPELLELQEAIPNLTHPAAPVGATDADNVEIAKSATLPPEFEFEPRDHVDLGEALGMIDFEAGSRVAGHGFYYLVGDAVLLDLALQQYAIRILTESGFTIMSTPDVARVDLLTATGYSPRGPESMIYSLEGTGLGLIATAEITLAGRHQDTIVEEASLPLRLGGLSHCFRTEAGAHGRATRGLYRVHQFSKVEMFAFTRPDQSDEMHAEMLAIERRIFDELGIAYRVVENATGDLGASAYRKFDIEAWMPGRGGYGEVTSTSNCTDYQARRLNVRYRSATTHKSAGLLHTLNGTALATGRAIVAIMENYQDEDGGIRIPDVLQPAMAKSRIAPR